MALTPYILEANSDDGNTYNDIPEKVTLPSETSKYFTMTFLGHYTPRYIADIVYGDTSLWWLVTKANGIIDPYSFAIGEKVRVLKPEFINEVEIG